MLRLPGREEKGIHLGGGGGGVCCHYLMHGIMPVISECLLDLEVDFRNYTRVASPQYYLSDIVTMKLLTGQCMLDFGSPV